MVLNQTVRPDRGLDKNLCGGGGEHDFSTRLADLMVMVVMSMVVLQDQQS